LPKRRGRGLAIAAAPGYNSRRSGTSKQVRERKLFEPMTNLWGAADRQPVCTACPFGFPAWLRSVRDASGAGKP